MPSNSPTPKPLRFTSTSTKSVPVKASDFLMGVKLRRSSVQSNSRGSEKGKNPIRGKDSVDSATSADSGYNTPFAAHYNASTSFTSYESHSPTHSADTTTLPKKSRGSLLIAASDALNFKFGPKRKSVRPPAAPVFLPEVIEITRRDEEVEERERLRDAAAQSIGLDPVLLHDTLSKEEESVEEQDAESTGPDGQDIEARLSEHVATSPVNSVHSMPILQPPGGRHRSGSALSHYRHHSFVPTHIPPFPTTPSVLTPSIQISSMLPKYYPPSSLRIFALSKHWKSRFMILSSPSPSFRGSSPTVSYLHLFKSSGAEESELERLEINEDSVVFVSEEDVGGRKSVIKVGGVDVGALKKELNHEEGGRTMWFLHIIDPSEAQQWIASIKNAILGQRTVRAGLGVPAHTLSGIEPRGDMDVMFSMCAQGIIASPPGNVHSLKSNSSQPLPATPSQTFTSLDNAYAASTSSHSLRSQATASKPGSTNAVSTLKGLFTGATRSRSASRAASLDDSQDSETKKGSLGIIGDHLMSMTRPNVTGDATPPSRMMIPSQTYVDTSLAVRSSDQCLDRRIVAERQPTHWTTNDEMNRPNRSYSVGAFSLQPPPRKRPWISLGPACNENSSIYKHSSGNDSVAGSFGIGSSMHEGHSLQPPASPTPTGRSSATFEQSARAPSLRSVSTYASNEPVSTGDRSSFSAKTKRWSRQGSLPKRLTPPSGPPPSVPGTQGSRLQPPHSAESPSSVYSETNIVSSPLTFSKRESASSAVSGFSVSSTSYSHGNTLSTSPPGSLHRTSMPPPPRPAPLFALPPPPDQSGALESTTTSKSSFRESITHRGFRLSLTSPKPPPSTVLPPLPDESVPFRPGHRRISSLGQSQNLSPIPASPPASSHHPSGLFPSVSTPISVSRHSSVKKRLRILSAPPAPSTPPDRNTTHLCSTTMSNYFPPTPSLSPPATPIGERITTLQSDPSFLSITPITPISPTPKAFRTLPTPPYQPHSPETPLSPLSPPPRRGSRQLEREPEISEDSWEEQPSIMEGENKLLSLSRRGSVISLGIVHVDI